MFTEQPAPPQPVAQVQPPAVDAVSQKVESAPPMLQRAIAAPEVLLPQSSVAPIPSPSPSPSPAPATPAAAPSSAPVNATTQRRREVEQHLAEIVSKQRAAQKAQQQQHAETDAAKYAGAGDLEQAKLAITKQALPKDVQAALLKKLMAKQGAIAKTGATAKNSKLGKAAVKPGEVSLSGIGATPGSYSTQAILPSVQPLMQFPMGLIGKNLSLIFPLTIAVPITSGFGWRVHPITGTPRFHRGLDFGAPYGSPVVAAKAGIIESADFVDGYGLTIVVRHSDTQQTLYAHLSQVLVKPGDVVKQGSLIGQVGSTGFSTGPHLHFEFLQMTGQGWVALDPAVLLNQAIATARNLKPGNLSDRGQTVQLSASGLLDITPRTAIAPGMIPGYSLLSEVTQPSLDQQASTLFPFAFLPTAVPEFSWFLSSLIDNFLTEQPNPLTTWFTLSSPAQRVSFQSLPALENSSTLATQPIAELQKNPAMTHPRFAISSSVVFHSGISGQTAPTAIASLPNANPMTSSATISSAAANLSRLTAYRNSIGGNLASGNPSAVFGKPLTSRLTARINPLETSAATRTQISAARQKTLPTLPQQFTVPTVHPKR